jgi:hypothetical protein
MYQYNDSLTQLFTKYKYIWLWLQCFDPLLDHHQAYIITYKVQYMFTFYVPNGILCGLQYCTVCECSSKGMED